MSYQEKALLTKAVFPCDFEWETLGKKLLWRRTEMIKADSWFPDFASKFDYDPGDNSTEKDCFGDIGYRT